ncbi:hypothetical protein [Stetteria hydrogenophila]
MPRRGARQGLPREYRCDEPPCIHVVLDERKKMVQVFFEDEEYITPIPADKLLKACEELREALNKKYREASGSEVDELARKYLNATPVEEEVLEEEEE